MPTSIRTLLLELYRDFQEIEIASCGVANSFGLINGVQPAGTMFDGVVNIRVGMVSSAMVCLVLGRFPFVV